MDRFPQSRRLVSVLIASGIVTLGLPLVLPERDPLAVC